MIFVAPQPEDVRWFMYRTSYRPSSEFGGIVALDEDGERLGMVGMDFWTPKAVQLHVAIDNPSCTIPLWNEVTKYLKQHGRKLAYAVTPSNNDRSLNLQKALGFEEKYRIIDGWDDGIHMIICERKL